MLEYIEDGTILVVPGCLKNSIIRDVREKFGLKDIKFMDILEFKKQFYFDYDNKSVYYLMEKYGWKYEVCLVYLRNLYYIGDKEYNSEKLNFLKKLKRELEIEGLLISNFSFKSNLINKKVVVYGFDDISMFYKKMFDEVNNICPVKFIERVYKNYEHKCIYEFDTLEAEVNFVCIKIIELLNAGVDINKIKIANVDQEYQNTLIKLFDFYKIPIYVKKNISLYSMTVVKYFLSVLDNNIDNSLQYTFEKFGKYSKEYNLIIDILNKFSWCEDYKKIKDMLIYEFKNTYIKEEKRDKQVECIDIQNSLIDDDYVFLMNFNQGNIPVIHKDEDYITDVMKGELDCLETTVELNKKEKMVLIGAIGRIKNLYISFKKESASGSYIVSNVNDELGLDVINDFVDEYKYSNLYNKLRLASDIDEFVKYGVVEDSLAVLYHNYSNIPYLHYKNNFTGIDKYKLREFINDRLVLSYSTINNYYGCGFKYFLNDILKLSIYEDTFMTTLGSLFHHVLEKAFNTNDFDIELEYNNYINECGKEFSAKEKFFLNKLKYELKFIIDSIKLHNNYSDLDKALFEETFYIDKSYVSKNNMSLTFMGVVDKIIYGYIEDKCIVSIIDYKTGNPNININNTIYGIEMQLPIYLYLIKKSNKFSNVYVAGFYLQKVLNNEILRNPKKNYVDEKRNNLKLCGYSNEEVSILQHFDSSFNDSKVVQSLKTCSSGFAHYSKVIDNNKINKLVDIVDKNIDKAIQEIIDGHFEINPKKIGKKNYGCEYCKFRDVCFMTENNIVNLKKYDNLEFLGGE